MSIILLTHNTVPQKLQTIVNHRIDSPELKVGHSPRSVAVNADTNRIYVANWGSNTVSVIDGGNNSKISEISVGSHPSSIDVDPSKNRIYVANEGSNTVSVIDGGNNSKISEISVGSHPSSIAVHVENDVFPANRIYVANEGSNTVSVIDGGNNSKISEISVGSHPSSIAVEPYENRIYVANKGSTNVSVIDGFPNTAIKEIPIGYNSSFVAIDPASNNAYVATDYILFGGQVFVIDNHNISDTKLNLFVGNHPSSISFDPFYGRAYVSNSESSTVSVIRTGYGTESPPQVIATILTGEYPSSVYTNPNTKITYVSNQVSNTVTAIDDSTNKTLAGITFNINPSTSGHIRCNNTEYPTNEFRYIESSTKCIAEPNKGFGFSSWVENLKHNSHITINSSAISDSPLNSLLSTLGFKPNDPDATLTVTQFGNFVANFEEVPPPIPPEYWIPLYGVIVSSIVGWSIPSIIGWIRSRKQGRLVHQYHKRIGYLYDDGKLDENDIGPLDKLKTDITDAYSKGKISDQQYGNLKDEISILYEEVYNKKIRSLDGISDRNNGKLLDNIKYDITDAYSKGKISKLHYGLLNRKISDYENNNKINRTT